MVMEPTEKPTSSQAFARPPALIRANNNSTKTLEKRVESEAAGFYGLPDRSASVSANHPINARQRDYHQVDDREEKSGHHPSASLKNKRALYKSAKSKRKSMMSWGGPTDKGLGKGMQTNKSNEKNTVIMQS